MTSTQNVTRNGSQLGFASGIVISVLLPIALLLFGLVDSLRAISLVFLFAGAWTILFGAFYRSEKLYWIGWGAGIAILSSVAILPFQYTIGLILVAIVVLIQ